MSSIALFFNSSKNSSASNFDDHVLKGPRGIPHAITPIHHTPPPHLSLSLSLNPHAFPLSRNTPKTNRYTSPRLVSLTFYYPQFQPTDRLGEEGIALPASAHYDRIAAFSQKSGVLRCVGRYVVVAVGRVTSWWRSWLFLLLVVLCKVWFFSFRERWKECAIKFENWNVYEA